MATRARQARNLPSTRWMGLAGEVIRNSSVPARRSSLHMRMVRPETRKISSTGIHSNSGRMSAMLRAKKRETQKKVNRQTARNTPMKMKAASEEKNEANSLRATRKILDIGSSLMVGCRDFGEDGFEVALLGMEHEEIQALLMNGAGDFRRDCVRGMAVQLHAVSMANALPCQLLEAFHHVEAGKQRPDH